MSDKPTLDLISDLPNWPNIQKARKTLREKYKQVSVRLTKINIKSAVNAVFVYKYDNKKDDIDNYVMITITVIPDMSAEHIAKQFDYIVDVINSVR